MANERVSQLNELLAAELQTIDLFLITDMSLKESKKMELSSLILFLQNSASFNAVYAQHSISASYVPAIGVDGTVTSASNAVWAINAAHAITADNCISASWSDRSGHADSASWAPPPVIGVTASYALRSGYADGAVVAYFLFYNGQPNGTASWAISSSYALTTGRVTQADTASFLLYQGFPNGTASYALNSISSSVTVTASYALNFPSPTNYVKAFAQITWSNGVALPRITMQYNISSVVYLDKFTTTSQPSSYVAPATWSQFAVIFATPLSHTNYMVIGDGYQPYALQERAGVICHPIHSNRTINGFTMSIVTPDTSDFYTAMPGTYHTDEWGFVNFQVLGI
jgi:hypothetical protein